MDTTVDTIFSELYYVRWIDSRGCHASWTRLEDMDTDPCILKSVGWLLRETDEAFHIVAHVGTDPQQGCGDMVIPKSAILEKHRLYKKGDNND